MTLVNTTLSPKAVLSNSSITMVNLKGPAMSEFLDCVSKKKESDFSNFVMKMCDFYHQFETFVLNYYFFLLEQLQI